MIGNIVSQQWENCKGTLPIVSGKLDGREVSVLRDTGSVVIACRKSLVNKKRWSRGTIKIRTANGEDIKAPRAVVRINTPYISGEFIVVLLDNPPADLIVGNVGGAKPPSYEELGIISAVETREQKRAMEMRKEKLGNKNFDINVNQEEFRNLQSNDKTLESLWLSARKGEGKYTIIKGLLYKLLHSKKGPSQTKLVIPLVLREKILKLGHDTPMAGHMGIARTKARIFTEFTWPGATSDIKNYCVTCDICQKGKKIKNLKAPLSKTSVIGQPFDKIAIDIVGPLNQSKNKHRFILTAVDMCTRWPEAVPLKNITAGEVQDALVSIFTRMGFPAIILSDNGSQFTSEIFNQVSKLLGIKIVHSSVYHAMSNGLVERWNGTFKEMLKKITADRKEDWDEVIPAALFAYREVPSESTGYSPFELMFGRKVRGPMSILKSIFTDETVDCKTRMAYDYLLNLKQKLQTACKYATFKSEQSKDKSKQWYDRNAYIRDIREGDHVLLLKPQKLNKLELRWAGPFKVEKKLSNLNFEVRIGNKIKIYHLNRMILYHTRNKTEESLSHPLVSAIAGVINEEDNPDDEIISGEGGNTDKPLNKVKTPDVTVATDLKAIKISNHLTGEQRTIIDKLIQSYTEVISNIPGRTSLIEHEINLKSDKVVRVKPYSIPYARRETMRTEIEEMIKIGIIERSNSEYCSPVVLVKKRDGSTRFCVDYRKLNSITTFDAEPIPDQEELFAKLNEAKFLTKLDMTKGYWQIKIADNCKKYTAFWTPWGLFHFNYLPFGLSTAPATFARLMRMVLQGVDNVVSFFDDICIFSKTFDEHLKTLETVFNRLKLAGLTIKPSKMEMAFEQISFLGHVVGKGIVAPEDDKINKILNLVIPKTKKQVRSLVGLISYYSKFIPNFSEIKAVLTDLLRNNMPERIVWTDECERALSFLKKILNSRPVLILPNIKERFVLQTDASSLGIGAVLLQYRNNTLRPVKYISRKLSQREKRYSTIERECLSIIWAVSKLALYLSNTNFTLQTDQKALQYMNNCSFKNSRLTRWSILLSEFQFKIQHIPGKDNTIADYLSRNFPE